MNAPAKISYSIAEAAMATGYSESTIKRAIARGDLAAHRPADKPVILHEELHDWVASAPSEPRSA